jgi:hypothetical protein
VDRGRRLLGRRCRWGVVRPPGERAHGQRDPALTRNTRLLTVRRARRVHFPPLLQRATLIIPRLLRGCSWLIEVVSARLWNSERASAPTRSRAGVRLVEASVVSIAERYRIVTIAVLNRRDFTVVRPRHVEAFKLLPGPVEGPHPHPIIVRTAVGSELQKCSSAHRFGRDTLQAGGRGFESHRLHEKVLVTALREPAGQVPQGAAVATQ